MALTEATLNAMADTAPLSQLVVEVSVHTAGPAGTGANESTAARVAVTWLPASGGTLTADGTLSFTGGTPDGPITHAGLWGAAGEWRGDVPLSGASTFSSKGTVDLTDLTIPGTSSDPA